MGRKIIVMLLLAGALAAGHPSAVRADIRTENAAEIKRVEDYLNALTTVTADFSQIAPDGTLSGGKFFLKRPGKMRWEYEPPTPVLMIANGSAITYYDSELEQVSHIPVGSTLAGFLAREKIDLADPSIKIREVAKTEAGLRLTLAEADGESGSLTLEFSDEPLQLQRMVAIDAQGQSTTVSLSNAKFGEELANRLFVFEDPRKRQKR